MRKASDKVSSGWNLLVVALLSGALACSAGDPMGPIGEDDVDDPGDTPPDDPPNDPPEQTTTFTVLTYNVAGLPQGISGSDPMENTPQMSPLLNNYDLALVQEDFTYHDQLAADAQHPYQSETMATSLEDRLGDGLNRFSLFPFTGHERHEWEVCNGYFDAASDCLTTKGFSVATHTIDGVEVDIYNLHMDAGSDDKDIEARADQVEQMVKYMLTHSAGRPMIVAGDTNMKPSKRPADGDSLAALMDDAGLIDSCRSLSCPEPNFIDRVLVRGSEDVEIVPVDWQIDTRFVTDTGEDLSDHPATGVTFKIVY